MGANDTGEQLAAAKEECIRLEAEIEGLKGAIADAGRQALLQAATEFSFSDQQWRTYQELPDQGYSHRGWLEATVTGWLYQRAGH